MNNHDLYCKDAKGKLRVWSIWSIGNTIHFEYGLANGQKINDSEIVAGGLAGRSIEEQVESRVSSRCSKKKDAGYVYSIENALQNKRVNKLGLAKPMLAHRIEKIKSYEYNETYLQKKYDGHRCLISNQAGELIAYSRNGKVISTIDHILDGIKIPENCTIDGELYHHGTPLQTIGSWAKKQQPDTKKLKFICYDYISDECYSKRFSFISNLDLGQYSEIAHTALLIGEFDYISLLIKAIADGYEGLIMRPTGFSYEDGKRSKGLIKIKQWCDDEFTVHRITKSVDGHAILHCFCNRGLFRVTAPGTHSEKAHIANNQEKYLGRTVTIQYANFTKDGVPFHPVAKAWRSKEDE